jgi:hypothetical protein
MRTDTELPYGAVSMSKPDGRAMEWQGPLWDAIAEWASLPPTRRGPAVVRVLDAVHVAMRLAVELSAVSPDPARQPVEGKQ